MRKIAICVAMAVIIQPVHSKAQIVETAATGAVLDQIRGELDSTIDSARQSGEFLIYQAGVQARDLLDTWKKTNAGLLDDAFSKLDKQTRDIFLKMDVLTKRINTGMEDRLGDAQRLTETALLIPTSLPFAGKTYVTRYTPKILIPGSAMPRVFTISGANLAEADPVVALADETRLQRISLTSTEAQYALPTGIYETRDGSVGTIAMKITYTRNPTAIFKKKVTKDLVIWALPAQFGTYSAIATVATSRRETSMVNVHTGKIKGRDKNIEHGITPPGDWKFDLDRMDQATLRGDGGEAASCQNFPQNDRSENGIRVQARVDHINEWGSKKDGWIRCIATVPVYRVIPGKATLDPVTGPLVWNDDIRVAPPPNLLGWNIMAKTMDGRTTQHNGDALTSWFDMKADSAGIIIHPIPPRAL